ncbi:hypothetical protein GCK32_011165 [Trichostrongylus colubriformis]|uniref:Uncharacterized protein n=1 Tax=Trichostrongylus colubriformis TaxID=6319 RepID=A0AAN8F333_TRICO
MVGVGRRLMINKASLSKSDLSPPKAATKPVTSNEQVFHAPCSSPEAVLADVDSAPYSPSQPLLADDVHFEKEPKARQSRRRSRSVSSVMKTVIRRLSRSRTPCRRLSFSACNADDTLPVDK